MNLEKAATKLRFLGFVFLQVCQSNMNQRLRQKRLKWSTCPTPRMMLGLVEFHASCHARYAWIKHGTNHLVSQKIPQS